ncbi:MAG: type I methionyl aminopeptidase [Rikenellaceae bacterium]
MIYLKNQEEIQLLWEANQLVGKTLGELAKHIAPGVTTLQLDKIAEEFIRDNGAIPSFKGYGGFPATLCTSVNEVVVHGIPNDKALVEGDVISVDCGTFMNGFCGDSAYTFAVGEISPKKQRLLEVTKEALYKGIAAATPGNRIGDISFSVQNHAEFNGYSVVREMVGHGLGKVMHEDPQVPNYGRKGAGIKLQEGLVICIEPMINAGVKAIVFERDGWTVRTKDKEPAAHFEHCIAVTKDGPKILSTFSYIEEVLKSKI